MNETKVIVPNGATPLTIADAVIRECNDKDVIEDVIYYLQVYVQREWRND